MNESVKRTFVFHGFMVLFLLGTIITGFLFYLRLDMWKKIESSPVTVNAIIIKEEQNTFGGRKSYRYLIEYEYKNQRFREYDNGFYSPGHFKIGQNVEIVFQEDKPRDFFLLENISIKEMFIVSVGCLLMFLGMLFFRSRILQN